METQREYFEVVSGDANDEIAVIYSGQDLLLRPIFIENDDGERDVLCFVPQSLQEHENELFTRMVCDMLRAGMQEAFPGGEESGSHPTECNQVSIKLMAK